MLDFRKGQLFLCIQLPDGCVFRSYGLFSLPDQNRLFSVKLPGIRTKAEILFKYTIRDQAAHRIHALPYIASGKKTLTLLCLIYGRILGQKGKDRHQLTGQPVFPDKILFGKIIHRNLCGGSGTHHLDPPLSRMFKIFIHISIPLFRDQRKLVSPFCGMIPQIHHMISCFPQSLCISAVKKVQNLFQLSHRFPGHDTDLQLCRRL